MDRLFRGTGSRLRGESQQEAAPADGTRDLDRAGGTVEQVSNLPKREVERMTVADDDVTTFTEDDAVDVSAEDDTADSEESSSSDGYWSYHGEEGGWLWVAEDGSEPDGEPPAWPSAEDNPGLPGGGYWLMSQDPDDEPVWFPGPDGSLPDADSIPGDGSGYWANIGGQQVWVDGSVNADATSSDASDIETTNDGEQTEALQDVDEVVADDSGTEDQTDDDEEPGNYTITPGEGYERPEGVVWADGDATITIGTGDDSTIVWSGDDGDDEEQSGTVIEDGSDDAESDASVEPAPEPEPEPEHPDEEGQNEQTWDTVRPVDVGDLNLGNRDVRQLLNPDQGDHSGATIDPRVLTAEDLRVNPGFSSYQDLSSYLNNDDDDDDDDDDDELVVAKDYLIEKPVIENQPAPGTFPTGPQPKAGESLDVVAGTGTAGATAQFSTFNDQMQVRDIITDDVSLRAGEEKPAGLVEELGSEVFVHGQSGVPVPEPDGITYQQQWTAKGKEELPRVEATGDMSAQSDAIAPDPQGFTYQKIEWTVTGKEEMPQADASAEAGWQAQPSGYVKLDLTGAGKDGGETPIQEMIGTASVDHDLDFKLDIAGGASPDTTELGGDEVFPVASDATIAAPELGGDELFPLYQDRVADETYLPTTQIEPALEFKNAGGNYDNGQNVVEPEVTAQVEAVEFQEIELPPAIEADATLEDSFDTTSSVDDDDGLDGI